MDELNEWTFVYYSNVLSLASLAIQRCKQKDACIHALYNQSKGVSNKNKIHWFAGEFFSLSQVTRLTKK